MAVMVNDTNWEMCNAENMEEDGLSWVGYRVTLQTHEIPETTSIPGTGEIPTSRWTGLGLETAAHGRGSVPLRVFSGGEPGCLTVPPNGEMGEDLVERLVRMVGPRMHSTRGSLRRGSATS